MSAPRTYALPGSTNHVIISGESSLDQARQHTYVNTIVDAAVSNHPDADEIIATTVDGVTPPESNVGLQYLPYCFIADTDSVEYIIDTGANRIIINNRKLFVKSRTIASSVKGIGGNAVKATAVGDIHVPLKSNDGVVDYITVKAVYVPSYPFNLIPHQVLITEMKRQGYHSARAEHDHLEYVFSYKPQADSDLRTITIRSGPNLLFTLRSNEGFLSFFNEAEKHDPEWKAFPGSTFNEPDIIPANDDSSTISEDSSATADKMRSPLTPKPKEK
jgi:hypothetical protein